MASNKKQKKAPPRSVPEPMPRVTNSSLTEFAPGSGISRPFFGAPVTVGQLSATDISGLANSATTTSTSANTPSTIVARASEEARWWANPLVTQPASAPPRNPWSGTGFGVPGMPSQPPLGRSPNLEPQASYQRVYPVYGHTIYESQAIRQNMTLEEALACADVLQRLFLINLEVVLTPKLPGGQVAELTPFNEIPGVTSATVGEWCVRLPGSNAAHILGDIVDQCDGTGADAMLGIVGVYQGITGVSGSYQDVRAALQLRRPVTSREVVQEWQRIFS